MSAAKGFKIGDVDIPRGERRTVTLPVSTLPDGTPISLSVHVVVGKKPGPTMFVSGVVHGDEVVGVEIVRRLLRAPELEELSGALLCVPIVNSYGFLAHSRYLPDRRDLNRCFPGRKEGALGEQLAHLFLTEIIARSDVGVDLHSASNNRANLPQIRIHTLEDQPRKLADAFSAPVILHAKLREGSMRAAARDLGKLVLLYESGEALRFDETGVRIGVNGCLGVMSAMGMIDNAPVEPEAVPVVSRSSTWIRAPEGGVFRTLTPLGASVHKGDVLGLVSDPFGERDLEVVTEEGGVVIGRSSMPAVNRGDALFHIARFEKPARAEKRVAELTEEVAGVALYDEDEIT